MSSLARIDQYAHPHAEPLTDSERLDFMAEYVDRFSYKHRTATTVAVFELQVDMVGLVTSKSSLRDALDEANSRFQEVNGNA